MFALDVVEATDRVEETLSTSLPGSATADASGEREPDDFEVDAEEWTERRFERRGSFGDVGGAIDVGE